MRYEDTSGSISSSATPEARGDADVLPNGSNGPATGNVITGAGTTTGKAGADTPASGHVVEVRGASGSDSASDGGNMHVDGRFGTLALDDHGNYKYVADGHAPQNFRDIFQYTLANSKGERSTADLVISRGGEIKVADNAQRIVPGPDGVVQLPAGVNLNDVHVVGRDLVVDMPDGTQIVIVDGAVFVPQLVLGGVEVPPTNLAALMIDIEAPRTVGGPPQSSGGNFDVPVPPLDPGVPLGDLIPPTELVFGQPRFEEIGQFINHEPTIEIQPEDQTPSVAAQDSVNERGLPSRNEGEPAGSGEIADGNGSNNSDPSEATTGTIIIDSPDDPNSVSITVNGVTTVISGVPGQVIHGQYGDLTITGFSGQNILYSYTLRDNTSGDTTHDDFLVTVTDHDGDQASATLRIDIIDDVPTARPDTDAVAAGTYGPETGNVLTGVGTTSGAAGADTVGADNAHISLVTGFNGSSDNSGPFVVNGQYGVLTMQSDGSYSYVRNPGTPGGVNDVFNYTLLDGDGDTSTTTLTISIGDATPHTGENPLIRFDDDALPGGNPGGVGDDSPDTVNASGSLAGGGGDGPITFAVQTTGAPAGFSYVSGGAGIVLIQQNGHTVLTVTVGANGSYSVVQNAPIDHAAGSDENNQVFTINYTVTDVDNDSAPGSFTINVDDDTPTVGIADRGVPGLTVDESDLGTNASASFASNFSVSFGADGPAAANSLVYALGISAPGADSGLIDVATGQHVLLSVTAGGVVEGRTAIGGDLVFTVSVNGSGDVTLDQIRAVAHPDTSNPDDSVTLASSNLVTLTATATDHDADSASQTLNIGTSLHFEDDGPSIQASQTQPDLTVDETVLATNASASFAGVFTSSFGADGAGTIVYHLGVSAPGADSGLVDTLTGQHVLLTVNGSGVVEGRTAIGGDLVFTVSVDASGNVTLDQIRAVVHADASNPDDSTTLSADSLVTLTGTITDKDGDQASATANIGQNLHFEDDGPSISPSGQEPSLTVDETILATNASASFAGAFTPIFGADGPLDANHDGIADAGAVTYALTVSAPGADSGLIDVATGQHVLLTVNGSGVVEGRTAIGGDLVFTVSVNAAGTVTLDQIRAVSHPDTSNPDDSVTLASDNLIQLTATAHDGDGDTASSSLNIGQNLNFEDDGPSVSANAGVQLDDDALAGGNPGGIGDDANATNTSGTLAHSFGADGAGSVAYLTSGAPAGFSYALQGNGDLWVMQGATHVLTLTVNSSTGAYTVSQVAPISHPAGSDENNVSFTISYNVTDHDGDSVTGSIVVNVDDDTPLANNDTDVTSNITDTADGNVISGVGTTEGAANHDSPGADGFGSITNLVGFNGSSDNNPLGGFSVNGQFGTLQMDANGNYTYTRTGGAGGATDTFTYTYVDGDGDPASATLTITLADNTPVAGTVNVGLDDDALANGNPGGIGDDPDSVNATGTLPGSGGDAPLTFGVLLTGAPAGFTYVSGGAGIVLVKQGATTVLTVTVNSTTGAYSVVQNAPIVHAAGSDENNQAFTINYTVTDQDTDVANGTINISVDDDTPTVSANAGVQLDDDALAGGNPGGIGDDANATNTSGTLAHSYGADGAGSVAYLTTGAPAGFSYALQGNGDLWVMQGATHVLTLTVNSSTGAYTVSQVAPIVHAAGSDENNQSFTISYRVTDGDGDTVDGSISVNVDDDTPTVSANAAVQLDDDALAGGNPGGIGDDADSTNTTGTLAHSYGADGAGSVAYLTTGAPAGFSYALQGNGDLWVMQGATHVLTLTVNSSTGVYTVSQVAPIVHAAGSDENNQAFTISYRVTDGDGDTVDGSISVNVDDDTPTVSANAAVQLDDDALAGGNAGGTGDVNPDTANTTGTLAHSYGADGAGSVALLGSGAPAGFTYDTSTPGTLLIKQGATTVITVTVNATTGAYTVTQNAPIAHPAGGDENDVAFTVNYRVSDSDGDTVDGSIVINVDDDTPTATINLVANQNVSVDESVGIQADSNDTTSASVVALFAGVAAPVGTDTDLPQYATNANAIVTSTGSSVGADGPGTTVFSLNVSNAGVDSGLDTTDGQSIFLFKEGNLIVGRVGNASGPAAFAIAIDNSGHISTVEYLSINHPNAANPDDSVSITNTAVTATVTVTDNDGDSAAQSVAIGSHIQFQDSGPVMTAADNINIQNSGDLAANGAFAYNLGADNGSADNNVISAVTFSAVVNGTTVQTTTPLTQVSEDSHTATFNFSFDYSNGTGTAHETGTITFYKDGSVPGHAAGTYSVDLDNPLQGISLVSVQGGSAPTFYANEHIGIVQVAPNVYMQFTGFSAMTATHNPFGNNDTFGGTNDDVHISSTDIGVHGNALQKGEVIDMDFLTSDPGAVDQGPQTTVTEAFIQVAQFNGEDMVVVLKLADPSNPSAYITRAIVVNGNDVLTTNQAGYPTLGANDGLIIIQPDDYLNLPGVPAGYQIAGMQITTSTQTITSVANQVYNFDGNLNAHDSSTTSFGPATVDNDVIKITNIGARVVTTTNQTADLTFNVSVKDGDGDTITQTVTAHISDAADSTTPATIPAANTTVAAAPLNPKTSMLVSDSHQTAGQSDPQTASNSNAILMGAFAAAGLAASHSVAAETIHGELNASVSPLATAAYHTQSLAPIALSVDGSHGGEVMPALNFARPTGIGEAATIHSAPEQFAAHTLVGTGGEASQPVAAAFLGGTAMPAHAGGALPAMAPVVAMPAAHQLAALGNGSVAGAQHNQVVSQVLADALHGGGGSPAIEHALASLPGHGGMGSGLALDVLASHNAAGVPFGDSSAFAGFSAVHSAISMEAMMVHVDAVQPHA